MEQQPQTGEIDKAANAMAMLGLTHLAYIRPEGKNGQYAVCAADGRQLAVFPSYTDAFYTTQLHDMIPVNVH